jgi:hypothetical protein
MPLSKWGGLAAGINQGIGNYATIAGVKAQQEASARAEENAGFARQEFAWRKAEQDRLGAPTGKTLNDIVGTDFLPEDRERYLTQAETLTGKPRDAMLTRRDIAPVLQHITENPDFKQELKDRKLAGLESTVGNFRDELTAAPNTMEAGSPEHQDYLTKTQLLKQKEAELNRARYSNPAWLKQEALRIKQQQVDTERTKAGNILTNKATEVASEEKRNAATNAARIEAAKIAANKPEKKAKVRSDVGLNPETGRSEYLMTDGSFSGVEAKARPNAKVEASKERWGNKAPATAPMNTPVDNWKNFKQGRQ